MTDILEAISRRVSVRDYQPKPAAAPELEEVRHTGEEAEALMMQPRYEWGGDFD